MHPEPFSPAHLLSNWPRCWIEVRCFCSPRVVMVPVRLLMERGDRPFAQVIAALRCSSCNGKPDSAYLVGGQSRTFTGGPPPSWSVELVKPAVPE